MIKGVLLTSTFGILLAYNSHAKIWRVNNTAGIQADFTTLTAAHTGASSGDTLHIEGSSTSYGSLTCSKKLIIIGPGYFLAENPNSQALRQTALVDGGITFNNGSQGSVVMGLDFNSAGIQMYCSDIVIRRNKFSYVSGTTTDWNTGAINLYYHSNNSAIPASNIIISQNYGVTIYAPYASSGVLITNNYIAYHASSGDATTGSSINLSANAVAIIQNNIFRRGKVTSFNSSFTNNIMVAGTFEGTANLVFNNLGNGTQFGTANGNQSNISMSTVFVGTGSPDGQWMLKAGSPAIGAGYGSTAQNPVDAGMFSSYTPYVLAGLPPVPAIYSFENKPVGSNTDPITVTIKVKSVGN